jgi:hypothetical protein
MTQIVYSSLFSCTISEEADDGKKVDIKAAYLSVAALIDGADVGETIAGRNTGGKKRFHSRVRS